MIGNAQDPVSSPRVLVACADEGRVEAISQLFPRLSPRQGAMVVDTIQAAYDAFCDHYQTLVVVVVSTDLKRDADAPTEDTPTLLVRQILGTEWHASGRRLLAASLDDLHALRGCDGHVGEDDIQSMGYVIERLLAEPKIHSWRRTRVRPKTQS